MKKNEMNEKPGAHLSTRQGLLVFTCAFIVASLIAWGLDSLLG